MSVTAERVRTAPKPKPRPRPRPQPRQTPAPRPRPAVQRRPQPQSRPAPRRVDRRSTAVFALGTTAVMVVMILGLVALNALLAQSSFQIEALQSKVDRLNESYQQRSVEAAELASPQRIADQAKVNGLYLPADGVHVLHVPSGGPARPHDQAAGERP